MTIGRVYAYFVMAYILEYLLGKHPQLQAVWEQMPKVPLQARAKVAFVAQLTQNGNVPPLRPQEIQGGFKCAARNNMQKLTWKAGMLEGTAPARQVLEMLGAHLQAHVGAASPGYASPGRAWAFQIVNGGEMTSLRRDCWKIVQFVTK